MSHQIAGNSIETSLKERLHIKEYSRRACLAALHGEKVPHALGHPLHRLCMIRGIRYHPGFGNELRGVLPVFTRALNARSIMSNAIPDIESSDDVPYCIWHPATASEETYRELARRYPHMAYHVGRACAVAGYTQLYQELDILPDVHIAEEARECGSLAIYEAIVSQIVRYSIMNDYTLSIDLDNRRPAYLNGDTAVHWMLDIKQEFEDATSDFSEIDGDYIPEDIFDSMGYHETMFNITEDMHIDECESDDITKRRLASRPDLRLLYEPLPADLPTVQKDTLIVMAAYLGNVDRYVRLRRPKHVENEITCCVRGIYHNTFFAVWWSKQTGQKPLGIARAINARFVMNNVLARAPFPPPHTPYLIWWPTIAQPSTYRHLAKLQPSMLPQIVRACIYAGYKDLFDDLLPQVTPDKVLLREAESQGNLHFRQALDERVKSLSITPEYPPEGWKGDMANQFGLSTTCVVKYLDNNSVGTSFNVPYDGLQCDATEVELMACLPDAWKIAADDEAFTRELDYEEWPHKVTGAAKNE